MCDRLCIDTPHEHIRTLHNLHYDAQVDWANGEKDKFKPRFSITVEPRQNSLLPIFIKVVNTGNNSRTGVGPTNHPPPRFSIVTAKWGINHGGYEQPLAKHSNVVDGSSVWKGIRNQRCVIPCHGFYKESLNPKGKDPRFVKYQQDGLMLLAGLWKHRYHNATKIFEVVIVTTDVLRTHQGHLGKSLPVILSPKDAFEVWLGENEWKADAHNDEALKRVLKPFNHRPPLKSYPVDKNIAKPGAKDSKSFIEPKGLFRASLDFGAKKSAERKQPHTVDSIASSSRTQVSVNDTTSIAESAKHDPEQNDASASTQIPPLEDHLDRSHPIKVEPLPDILPEFRKGKGKERAVDVTTFPVEERVDTPNSLWRASIQVNTSVKKEECVLEIEGNTKGNRMAPISGSRNAPIVIDDSEPEEEAVIEKPSSTSSTAKKRSFAAKAGVVVKKFKAMTSQKQKAPRESRQVAKEPCTTGSRSRGKARQKVNLNKDKTPAE